MQLNSYNVIHVHIFSNHCLWKCSDKNYLNESTHRKPGSFILGYETQLRHKTSVCDIEIDRKSFDKNCPPSSNPSVMVT